MIHLSVLYEEGDPTTYEGIELNFTGPEFDNHRDVFNTGVPVHDYLTAICALQAVYGDNAELFTQHLSSYNHFAFDGGDLPEDGFTDEQIREAKRAALLFLGPGYDLKMIQFLAEGLEMDELQRAHNGIGELFRDRTREAREALKARLVPMTQDELVAFHQPGWVRLDLNSLKLKPKYTKAIKAMGGSYSSCRGHSTERDVTLPLTPEGIKLGNELWLGLFKSKGKSNGGYVAPVGTMVFTCPGSLVAAYRVMRVMQVEGGIQRALDQFDKGIRRGAKQGHIKRMKDPLEESDEER